MIKRAWRGAFAILGRLDLRLYRFIGLAAALAVTGCATNAIRIDRAVTMTKAGRAATDKTREVMKEARQENREFLIDLVASDRNCSPTAPVIAFPKSPGKGRLCVGKPRPGSGDFTVRRIMSRDFEPSLAVIDGIVAYLDVVDAVALRKPLDLGATVVGAYEELNGVFADLETLTGVDNPVPELTSNQLGAVGSILTLLGEIIQEAEKVGELRRIEDNRDRAAFSDSLARLASVNELWLTRLSVQIASRKLLVARQLQLTPASRYDERHNLAAQQMRLIEQGEAIGPLKKALAKTVTVLEEAHRDYRTLLFGSARNMTKDEKRKAAAITRDRLRRALSGLAKAVAAF
jgi:hypothetical protein